MVCLGWFLKIVIESELFISRASIIICVSVLDKHDFLGDFFFFLSIEFVGLKLHCLFCFVFVFLALLLSTRV